MTWYAGVKEGNTVEAGDEPFESDDELLEHIRQNPEKFGEEPYIVQLREGSKTVYRARFRSGKWDLEPLMGYSTTPSAE